MLKIRDDIPLEELEKYGFEKYLLVGKVKYELKKKLGNNDIYNIKIDDNRVIHYNQMSVYNELPNVIYDLIQAGIVVKEWVYETMGIF